MGKVKHPQYGELAPRDFYIALIRQGGDLRYTAKVQGVTMQQIAELLERA